MIFSGGIWSICIMAGLAFGYARVFNAKRWVHFIIIGIAVALVLISQILPQGHVFRQSVRQDLIFLFWAGAIAVPVGIYTLFIRWARRKVEARHDA